MIGLYNKLGVMVMEKLELNFSSQHWSCTGCSGLREDHDDDSDIKYLPGSRIRADRVKI